MAAQGKTELNDGSGEDIVAGEDEARWRRWSLMVVPDKMESPRRGPRREAGAKDERSTEEDVREYSGAHVCDVITGHVKKRTAPHPHPHMLLEAAHRCIHGPDHGSDLYFHSSGAEDTLRYKHVVLGYGRADFPRLQYKAAPTRITPKKYASLPAFF
jgi:hypothetical protein